MPLLRVLVSIKSEFTDITSRGGGEGKARLHLVSLIVFVLCALCPAGAWCHGQSTGEPGLLEKTGTTIPSDLTFYDETGVKVNFRELVDKPTLLSTVYYSCSHMCPQFLAGLAQSLGELKLEPGRDYKVLTVSFDERDTPEVARSIKRNYMKAIDRPFPEHVWKFLTGDRENIAKLLDAAGLSVKRLDHGYIHPEVLIFLAPGGKITRYMHVSKYDYGLSYPITFTDFELSGAIADAARGKVCTVGATTPLYCFLHEPSGQQKFFTMMKYAGALTIVMGVSLFFYLRREEKLRRRRIEGGRDGR